MDAPGSNSLTNLKGLTKEVYASAPKKKKKRTHFQKLRKLLGFK